LSTSSSDVLYVSRLISSAGIVSGGKLATESQGCVPHQGKAIPVDPFTAEDAMIISTDKREHPDGTNGHLKSL